MERLQVALVRYWSAREVRVKCPYCLEVHSWTREPGDPPTGKFLDPVQRCMKKGEKGMYRLVYPGDTHAFAANYGWELDKVAKAFYAVDPAGRMYPPSRKWPRERTLLKTHAQTDGNGLVLPVQNLSVEPRNVPRQVCETQEVVEDHRRTYLNACSKNLIIQLKMQFAAFGDVVSTWTDDDGANGAVIAARQESGLDTVILLHEKRIQLNQQDNYGRTALMEAALWGRYDIAVYLILQGVDLHARDGNGMTALNLSSQLDRNDLEREDAGPGYREPVSANRNRKRIELYLKNLTTGTKAAAPLSEDATDIFRKIGPGRLMQYTATRAYDIPVNSWKAFGELDRGPNYPVIAAMSGFSHPRWPNVLDNAVWSSKALDLCNQWGHQTTRELASHVEKQLIAYYMERHVIFETDLLDLLAVGPLKLVSPVTITVNKLEMCDDCKKFVSLAQTIMGSDWDLSVKCVGE